MKITITEIYWYCFFLTPNSTSSQQHVPHWSFLDIILIKLILEFILILLKNFLSIKICQHHYSTSVICDIGFGSKNPANGRIIILSQRSPFIVPHTVPWPSRISLVFSSQSRCCLPPWSCRRWTRRRCPRCSSSSRFRRWWRHSTSTSARRRGNVSSRRYPTRRWSSVRMLGLLYVAKVQRLKTIFCFSWMSWDKLGHRMSGRNIWSNAILFRFYI